MGRIKIANLPEDHSVSKDEMRKVFGGSDPKLANLLSERNKISRTWWSAVMNAPAIGIGGDPLDPTFGGFDPGMGEF